MFERPRLVIVTGSGDRAAAVPLPLGSPPRALQSSFRISTKVGGRETVRLIEQRGGRAMFYRADVADELQVQQLIKFTESKFGAPSVLVNNASSPHLAGEGMAGWTHSLQVEVYYIRSDGGRIQTAASGARVIEPPGADHYLFLSNEADVLCALHTFLDGLRQASAVPATNRQQVASQ